ncbi:hypothetical protein OHB00_40930 [Streptomyces sp. NBC_00631]|uniref:hypothetical protein n=1 Tax=unclassified Streptomyces TaxID=2593676 RepID=UPI0030DF674F
MTDQLFRRPDDLLLAGLWRVTRRGTTWHLSATGTQISQIATMLGYRNSIAVHRPSGRW